MNEIKNEVEIGWNEFTGRPEREQDVTAPAALISALRERGFRDNSWHNDAAANFTREITYTEVDGRRREVTHDLQIVVWIAEADPAAREYGPDMSRFAVSVVEDGCDPWDGFDTIETDEVDECITAVDDALATIDLRA